MVRGVLAMLSTEHQQTLLNVAKQSIAYGLEHHKALPIQTTDYDSELQELRASFVTLHLNDNLRGCIGSLSAHQSLIENIAHNAYAAAFSDPRFGPVTTQEFEQLDYHISVLSESSPMTFSSQADLLEQIRPGIDGLILEDNGHRGTFLPSVWERLPRSADFFDHLKQKAGFPTNYWSDTLQVSRYTVESFS